MTIKQQRARMERLDKIRDASNFATLIVKAVGSATHITEANGVMIGQVVFEELQKPEEERDQKRVTELMKLALQSSAMLLRARSVDLGYARFHTDVAKRARQFAAELQEINGSDCDEREKLEKAMLILFGPEPAEFTSEEETAGAGAV